MKKLFTVLLFALCAATLVFAGGAKDANKKLTTVRVGIHANEGGAPLAAVAQDQGFFEKYGIEPVFTIVESGPAEMTAMRADNRTLDVGYIGAGVAWNPIDGAGNSLSFVFLDVLSNAEMLLAKKGIFSDTNGNGKYDNNEIYNGLKGKTVYIEVGTTPGGWFKNLIDLVNEGKPDADKLWISSETSSYLAGYIPPNTNPANRVTVINTHNSNLPAGKASGGGMDIIAAYSPATVTILNTNPNAETIATTVGNFPPEKSFPSTWVASDKWIAENPEAAQNFINALYEAALWRSKNLDMAMRAGENLSQKPEGTFDPTNLVAPTQAEYQEWFADRNGQGYAYMRALYDSKVGNVPAGNPVKSFEQSFNDTLMLNAIKNIK